MGGVFLMWVTSKSEGLEFKVGSFSISYQFRDCDEGFIWVFSNLYGPLKGNEIREKWEESVVIKGLWDESWCLAGDFNVVCVPNERSNCR